MGTQGCPPAAWWPLQSTPPPQLTSFSSLRVSWNLGLYAQLSDLITYSKQFTLFIVGFSKLAFSSISFPISLIIQIRNGRAGPYFTVGITNIHSPSAVNSWPTLGLSFPPTHLTFFMLIIPPYFRNSSSLSLWDILHMPSDSPLKNIQFNGFLSIFTKLHNYHYHLMILSSPQKENLYPLVVTSHYPTPALGNHQSTFCLYESASSGQSMKWNHIITLYLLDTATASKSIYLTPDSTLQFIVYVVTWLPVCLTKHISDQINHFAL